MALDNKKLRYQRRSFTSSGCDDTDDELFFEQVQSYVPPINLAWFDSSRASLSRILEHKLCECDSQRVSIILDVALDNKTLRDQRRSFTSSGCDDTDDELLFEQVQNYVPPIKLAWFDSSRASRSRILEHKLCECDSTIGELHRVRVRDDRTMASSVLLEDRAKLSSSPCHVPAPTRRRPHRVHRCITESLATVPTIVDAKSLCTHKNNFK